MTRAMSIENVLGARSIDVSAVAVVHARDELVVCLRTRDSWI